MTATILPFERPSADAVMALRSNIPDTAMTAELLGTERSGHAIQVSAEGLMLTTGYSVLEASEVWLSNKHGQSSEAIILAQDFNAGLALLKPMQNMGSFYLETTTLDTLDIDQQVSVLTSDSKPMNASIFAIEEFAGRWEYLLENAIYTVPLCEHWSGAALVNQKGQLVGIGSLALGLSDGLSDIMPGNLFIPVELTMPHLEHLSLHGELPGTQRPWLGMLAEEMGSELHVMGVYADAPAANAGIKPGDVILSVGSQPVSSMPGFFRTLWHYGPAGTDIPLTLRADDGPREVVLQSIDRNTFFNQRAAGLLN